MGLLARSQNVRTGKLERTSPVPLGRYWIDVFEPKRPVWEAWVAKAGASVHILSTEYYEGDADEGYPSRNWLLFEVLTPVEWGVAKDLGWPTIASQDVKTSNDTVDKPHVAPFGLPGGNGNGDSDYGWVKWAVGGVIDVGGIFAIASIAKSARGIL